MTSWEWTAIGGCVALSLLLCWWVVRDEPEGDGDHVSQAWRDEQSRLNEER